MEQAERKFPDKYKPPKKNKTPTNQLNDDIIKWFFKVGGCARRVNTEGQWREGKTIEKGFGYEIKTQGRWTPSGMEPGFEDIVGTFPIQVGQSSFLGIHVAVETKVSKGDKHRDAQKERQEEVEKAGGRYILARSFDHFLSQMYVNFPKSMQRLKDLNLL